MAVAPHLQGRQAGRQCQARSGQADVRRHAGAAAWNTRGRATAPAETRADACLPTPTFGKSSLGRAFLASSCTVCPFKVSSTASTTLSIWVTPSRDKPCSSAARRSPCSAGSERQRQGQDDAQAGRQAGGQAVRRAGRGKRSWNRLVVANSAAACSGAHLRHAAGHQQPLACLAPCAQACVHGRLAGALDGAGVEQPQVCAVTL